MGHTAVMQCKATGNPPPEIYWLKDTKRVDMGNKRYTLIAGKYKQKIFFFIYLHFDIPFGMEDRIGCYLFINLVLFLYTKQENRFK